MKKSAKQLSVRLNGQPVGIFSQTVTGRMRFKYLPEATKAISNSLPIQTDAYSHKACEAYFAGLLPESSRAKKAIAHQFDANPNSTFSLLRAIGSDCAGAISFTDLDALIQSSSSIETRLLPSEELEQHIIELPIKPLFLGTDGLRLSLAGVQEKAAVCVVDDKIFLPILGTPTTYILKPVNNNFPRLVANEYLCLRTAQRAGLPVPRVHMDYAGAKDFLLVKRYDRKVIDSKIERIHQEDFCQALSNRQKYEQYDGPSHRHCFELLQQSTFPVLDRNLLMGILIYNFLIGNGDAHGKNFSLRYGEDGSVRLAPFYDLVCTQVYEGLSDDMSMKIGKNYQFSRVNGDDWKTLAKQVGFSYPTIRQMLKAQASTLPTLISSEREAIKGSRFDGTELDQIVAYVNTACERSLRMIDHEMTR
jgi:serine/threonine-protein kinase HipA